jgi:nucleoside-diphosphate-sugar epimerase
MRRIVVTGAGGQIGSELVPALRERYGRDAVLATDIRAQHSGLMSGGPFQVVDCTKQDAIASAVLRHRADTIFHLAAILSAIGEKDPQLAYRVNMGTLLSVLEVARCHGCAVFTPSSIGAFGPSTPLDPAPQDTIQRPTTMYGVTKVAGELLCDYYGARFGLDTRGLRFPGLISYVARPGGGTTDYAVEIFYAAIREGRYTCFLAADTRLDMMYMPDAIRASIELMEADPARLLHRNAFNIAALQVTPAELAAEIKKHIPGFEIDYDVDPQREAIAQSWPRRVDDSAAQAEWDWKHEYGLERMVEDMLEQLSKRLQTDSQT